MGLTAPVLGCSVVHEGGWEPDASLPGWGRVQGAFAQPHSPCSAEHKVTISDRRRPGVQA